MIGNQNRIFGLDLMRAIAILMVIFGHCVWIFPERDSLFQQLMLLSGFLGVEIFFVLSGFLIGKILYKLYLKDDFSIKSVLFFLKRRWFRTLPNYYLVLVVNVIITSIFGNSLLDVWKYFFFVQNAFTPMQPFFTESWSLSVEEFAYIVLPLFLFFAGSIVKPKHKSRFFLVSVLMLILVFFCAKIGYQNTTTNTNLNQWNMSLKAVVIYRLDSIFIGVLCSWIYLNFNKSWKKNRAFLFVFGMFLFFFQFVAIGYFGLFIETNPIFWNVVYLPLVSIMVACFLPFLSEWKTEKSIIRNPIVFISVISYSMYLLHYGIVLRLLKHNVNYNTQRAIELYSFSAAYIFLTIILSYLLYRFYEKPIMDLRDKNQE
jgi:peptidoglycan/LPS O-acetylase OafA/YrhL